MSADDLAVRLYRRLARAFPFDFRQEYGEDLVSTADDAVRAEARRRGWIGLSWLIPRLLGDLLLRIAVEQGRDGLRDVRYAARTLAASPGFAAAAVACLAIGTGLAAAMYSQIQSTVFRDVPGVGRPGGLVRLQQPVSLPYFRHLRDAGAPLSVATAYMGPVPFVVGEPGDAAGRVWGHIATPEYFDVLEARMALGRSFGEPERTPGAARAVVLSHRIWRGRFGGDPAVVGRPIRVNGQAVTVIGIAADGFLGASPTTAAADLWLPTTAPIALAPELTRLEAPLVAGFDVVGRLRPGTGVGEAEAALDAQIRQLEQTHGDPARHEPGPRVRLLPGGSLLPLRDEDLPRAIGFPLVLVSLVLLMACGNVANMLLARSAARRREIAVRLSLGAGPSRIVRQLLTEGLLLTGIGAVAGLAFTIWLLSVFDTMRPMVPSYGMLDVRLEWTAFAAAAGLAALFTVLFGLAPAREAARDGIYAGLKPHAPGTRRRWWRTQNILVFQQVTVSVALLLLTGFVVVGWQRSAGVDVGFEPANLHLLRLDPVRDGQPPDAARRFFAQLASRLRRVPGIVEVAVAQSLPGAMSSGDAMLTAKVDFAGGAPSLGAVRSDRVGVRFFEAAGIPLRHGRTFTEADEADGARVAVVSENLAAQTWPDADVLGRTLDLDGAAHEVVGVVGDVRSAFPLAPAALAVYRPIAPEGFATPSRHGVVVAVRTTPGVDVAERLRREVEAVDPRVTVLEITRATDDVASAQFLATFATAIYGGMGIFGLILASVGLASVTAHAVARRRHEIGIRMALGAQRADVLWLVLRESGAIVLAGTLVGLGAALALTRALASVVDALAETTATTMTDPLLLAGAPALLAALALLACYLPARQSTRVNPVTALRAE